MRTPALFFSTAAVVIALGGASLSADRIKLRSGQAVTGAFMSADVKIVRMLLDNGSIAEFKVDDIAALEFSPRKAPPAAAATPDPPRRRRRLTCPKAPCSASASRRPSKSTPRRPA